MTEPTLGTCWAHEVEKPWQPLTTDESYNRRSAEVPGHRRRSGEWLGYFNAK